MMRFIDEHRGVYGVEPICKQLPYEETMICSASVHDNQMERSANSAYYSLL
jgi:hypothetical protein